ncbi:MAG: hypothetical protein ABUL44_00230 [Flavobacterium sp.]
MILFFVILVSSKVYGQDRINKSVPTISKEVYGKLTDVTGWRLNKHGQWDSVKNAIDFGDNFISYELRKFHADDTTYYILIKKYNDSYYEYPALKEGLHQSQKVYYYIFDTARVSSFRNIVQGSSILLKIPVKYVCFLPVTYFNDDTSDENTIKVILRSIHSDWKVKDPIIGRKDEMLCLNLQLQPQKDIVRFLIFKTGKSHDQDEIQGVTSPFDFKVSPDNLKSFYYETTLANFQNLFKDLTVAQ